jgi:GH15 family glucan-1,4-alpha-glucosidase
MLNLISNFPLSGEKNILKGARQSEKRDIFWFSLTFEKAKPNILLPIGDESESRISITKKWWQDWCGKCKYEGPWSEEVLRSAITLRMLTFTTSGALLAAATTSLPEKPGGWMNWDYRYCWPRDAALTLSAFIDIGLRNEADAFFGWLMLAANATRPYINIVYDLFGRRNLKEKILNMSGWQGAQPVRIGNKAAIQLQHDVYGEVMLAVEDWVKHFGAPDASEKKLIEGFGKSIKKNWRKPDRGIWEIRDKPRHYTYSKVMAWYVFNSLIRLQEKGYISIPLEDYKKERDELKALIEERAFNKKRNCFTGAFDEDAMDASLLLLPRCGFVKYDDPRMKATWEAIQQDLEINGLILRYPPGFAGSQPGEGAFIICNFWAVDYLTGSGHENEANERLERLIGLSNDAGLFNEAVEVNSLNALGNMPQAFSHAGLINSVMMLMAGKGQQAKKAA